MYESQHHINTSKNMAWYKQVIRTPPPPPTGDCLWKGILRSQDHHPPLWSQPSSFHWMKVTTKLHCLMYFNLCNISKKESFSSCTRHEATGDISLRICTTQKNNDMLWNKVTGSLASLSMICLASKILCQLGCHLLWLCGSVVNLLLCTTCERRWQGLSIICLAAW